MSGLSPAAQAFSANYRAGNYGHSGLVAEPYVPAKLTLDAEAFAAKMRNHRSKMENDTDYATNVRQSRMDCDKCDMEIVDNLSKCKGSSCSMMGGKKRSNRRSKKSRSRRTISHRRRSRARRSI
jgi:hypothetical protein